MKKWDHSFATSSKFKKDFVNVRAMYRLLGIKGYRFPRLQANEIEALNENESGLRSKEEVEQEKQQVYGAVMKFTNQRD